MPSRPVLISDMPGVVFLSLKSKNGHARYRACGECDVSKFISSYWLEAPVEIESPNCLLAAKVSLPV
jgi:hypothetical protein